MKTRTAFPLLYALSFLMVSAGSGSARINAPYPYDVQLSLDSAFITYDFHQAKITPDTVRGSIQDMSMFGSFKMTVNIKHGMQWITTTRIDGNVVQDGDIINVAQGAVLPVEIIFLPYPDGPDTESYCLTLSINPTYILNHRCIPLTITNNKSAVGADLAIPKIILEPNPAGNYIYVRGLSDMQEGYSYEIFSISGIDVSHGMLPSDSRINLQDLASGAYRLLLFDAKRMLANTSIRILH